jgi:hypothetical protein
MKQVGGHARARISGFMAGLSVPRGAWHVGAESGAHNLLESLQLSTGLLGQDCRLVDESGVVVPSRPVRVLVYRHVVAAHLKSDLADAYHDTTTDRSGQWGGGREKIACVMPTCKKDTHARG